MLQAITTMSNVLVTAVDDISPIDDGLEESYKHLCAQILFQAIIDYEKALVNLSINEDDEEAQEVLKDTTDFFLSQWFEAISMIDGKKLMQLIEERVEDGVKNTKKLRKKRLSYRPRKQSGRKPNLYIVDGEIVGTLNNVQKIVGKSEDLIEYYIKQERTEERFGVLIKKIKPTDNGYEVVYRKVYQ